MNKSDIAVVIPVYRHPYQLEKISLYQCLSVLGEYRIIAVMPENAGKDSFGCTALDSVEHVYFPDEYFNSIESYNRLVLSDFFYKKFDKFEYMLIYQLDAYVFNDRLLEWAKQGYDYIGAPWIPPFRHYRQKSVRLRLQLTFKILSYLNRNKLRSKAKYRFYQVGNGGLSLRNVKKFIELTSCCKTGIRSLLDEKDEMYPEDILLAIEFCHGKNALKKPDFMKSLDFSFEMSPELCLSLNGKRLPFGCHAWYLPENYDFWKKYIKTDIIEDENICNYDKLQ